MAVTKEIDVRFRDLDVVGHVNNAVISTYVEEARLQYLEDVFEVGFDEYTFVIARIEIDFERPIQTEGSVEVTAEVPELGTSSVPMRYEIVADGERAATAETTLVFLDQQGENTVPIPDDVRERIETHEGL
ncbi:thioesterase family protein [Salinarchaeum chitinilyticum]